MKLRWLVKKYPQPTKEAVVALWNNGKEGLTMSRALEQLTRKDEGSLQVWVGEGSGTWGWEDVPIVIEEVKE